MEIQEQQNGERVEKKSFAISLPAAIVSAAVIIAVALLFSGKGSPSANTAKKNIKEQKQETVEPDMNGFALRTNDYIRGDISKASVVIVEYSDSDCPFCQRFHATMKQVLEKYGTKVAWVYRYFPLNIHPNAENEAKALECVGSLGGTTAFWNYLDQIIDITVAPDKSQPILSSLAVKEGVDAKLFANCFANPKTEKIITDQSVEAQSFGAQGTPYSIVIDKAGNKTPIAGAYPFEEIVKILDPMFK